MSPKRLLMILFSAVLMYTGCAVPAQAAPGHMPSRQQAWAAEPALSPQMVWLSEHPQEYGTYVIGPAASSYQSLYANQTDGYYALADGGEDYPALAAWLLEHCQVSHLVLALSLTETDAQVIQPLSPVAAPTDRQLREVEKIGALSVYQAAHGQEFYLPAGIQPPPLRDDARLAAQIRALCEERGVRLSVVLSPVFQGRWALYSQEDLRARYAALAREVDFWDFSLTSASFDSRYFYNSASFRPALGAMVMAQVLGTEGAYRPDGFGSLVTSGTCQYYLDWLFDNPPAADPAGYTADVPILLYHHVVDELGEGDDRQTVVSTATFERQMRQLAEEGYHAVSSQELIDYVYRGAPLPDKPVYITFDDGYYSNYALARPILEKYGMKATIFSIGVSMGSTQYYKDTSYPTVPHFGYEEARELERAGAADIQSHTYDMHQWAPYETGDCVRSSILPLEGERYADYAAALLADLETYDQKRTQELGGGFAALAYPGGEYCGWTEALVHQAGISLTLSTSTDRRNVLVKGLPQSLYALCRWYVTEDTTPEGLRAILQGP